MSKLERILVHVFVYKSAVWVCVCVSVCGVFPVYCLARYGHMILTDKYQIIEIPGKIALIPYLEI